MKAGGWVIFFAVPEEAKPFLRLRARVADPGVCLPGSRRGAGGWRLKEGMVWVTGMGGRNAERVAGEVLATGNPSWVLTCGFAGGLDPGLAVGTILADLDPGHGLPSRLSSGLRRARFHCAGAVADRAEEKARLRRETGADAVEMESSIIRALCAAKGIPSGTIRVISDAAGEDLPLDFGRLVDEEQRLSPWRLGLALARAPWRIPRLIRFGRRVSTCARGLAEVLSEAVGEGAEKGAGGA